MVIKCECIGGEEKAAIYLAFNTVIGTLEKWEKSETNIERKKLWRELAKEYEKIRDEFERVPTCR